MMGKASREKGKRGERMWAAVCRDHGWMNARRGVQYSGREGEADDVTGLPGIHQEVKFVERLNLYDAMDQSLRDASAAGRDEVAIVAHKKSRCGWLVTMNADDFFRLYQSYYTDMRLDELKGGHVNESERETTTRD